MDLSIITISTNEGGYLAECLASYTPEKLGIETEFFVFNNASTDNTLEVVKACPAPIRLITQPRITGFSTNNNQGIIESTGRYVLLLNPDTILHEGVLEGMVRFMDAHPEYGAAGCKLLNPDGTIQHTCRHFPTPQAVFYRWLGRYIPANGVAVVQRYLMADWDHAEVREVDWVMGAFLMLRRTAIDKVGMLDTTFDPLYYEDIDWCARAHRAGLQVVYNPHFTATHKYHRESAASLNWMTWYHMRNVVKFWWKHREWLKGRA